jgi:hypothetical protein
MRLAWLVTPALPGGGRRRSGDRHPGARPAGRADPSHALDGGVPPRGCSGHRRGAAAERVYQRVDDARGAPAHPGDPRCGDTDRGRRGGRRACAHCRPRRHGLRPRVRHQLRRHAAEPGGERSARGRADHADRDGRARPHLSRAGRPPHRRPPGTRSRDGAAPRRERHQPGGAASGWWVGWPNSRSASSRGASTIMWRTSSRSSPSCCYCGCSEAGGSRCPP